MEKTYSFLTQEEIENIKPSEEVNINIGMEHLC
jgi:hypothetical protein